MKAVKEIIRKREALSGKGILKLPYVILIAALFAFSSCYVDYHEDDVHHFNGSNGYNGNAYLALTWSDVMPDYLDAGTYDIPGIFEWGAYYHALPGFYWLYYDGCFWNGHYYEDYAWEIEYEIWTYAGESGGYNYHGADGPDTYFTLECNPYGPYSYMYSMKLGKNVKLVEKTDEKVVIEKKNKGFGMTITYKKVEPREHKKELQVLGS